MFSGHCDKKILSYILSLSLFFPYAPVSTAKEKINPGIDITSTKRASSKFTEKFKSIVSNPKFIIPAASIGAISLALVTPYIYNTKCVKPRNPIENNICGESDERIKAYDTTYNTYADFSNPEFLKRYYGNNYNSEEQRRDKALGAKINEILQEMNKHGCKTDFEKAVFLHDYIYDHCKYPLGTMVDIITNKKTNFDPPFSYYASGCLLDGKAKCSGIAEAYMLLLNSAGVKCRCVHGLAGTKKFSGMHAWNIVQINGQWYHVDVTFDLSFKATHGRYKYFMLTEEEISKNHDC